MTTEPAVTPPPLSVEEWIALPDAASDPERPAAPPPRRRRLSDLLAMLAGLWTG